MGERWGGGRGRLKLRFFCFSPSPAFDVVAPMVGCDGTAVVVVGWLIDWLVDSLKRWGAASQLSVD